MAVPQKAMAGWHELGVSLCACLEWVLPPIPSAPRQFPEVLRAAWRYCPGPGGGFCLGFEVSAAALSEAVSKFFFPPLGERVFIFLNFQQMKPEPSPGIMCLLPQPAEKQVRVMAWKRWSCPLGTVPSGKPAPRKSPYESCLCKQAPKSSLSLPL